MHLDKETLKRPKRLFIDNIDLAIQLTNHSKVKYLTPFMKEPKSLSEVAKQGEFTIASLSYWVKIFIKEGILNKVSEKKRAGKAIKYYWAAADEFLLPVNEKVFLSSVRHIAQKGEEIMINSYLKEISDVSNIKALISFDKNYEYLGVDIGLANDQTFLWEENNPLSILSKFLELELSKEDAIDLYTKMTKLYGEFLSKLDSSGKGYIVHLGLMPTEIEDDSKESLAETGTKSSSKS